MKGKVDRKHFESISEDAEPLFSPADAKQTWITKSIAKKVKI